MSACVQAERLTKRYGAVLAVQDLSFEVQTGEIMGLLGLNGAGKSTTLYMLTGLVAPTSGTVSIFGKPLDRQFLDIAARIGVLVERPVFHDYMSARDNLSMCARLAGREATVDRALDRVGLRGVSGRRVGTFSMGMRQRLGLAQALLLDPELLILDEPANGLDPEATQEMMRLLKRLSEESQVTILMSSHMLHEAETLCDRVAVLHEGRLVACDKTQSVLSFDETHVDVLMDAPEAAAKRLQGQPWVASLEVDAGRIAVTLREPNAHQLIAFLVTAGYRLTAVIPR
ncbi:MAG: ABC transporter ATP-binding protein, partial [Candidatus Hydrogenedentes bacterium]|nr:ABC transporter ATP-binding protein [Candidatus Hydrogenedentota bacterium]